ncbi:hypothetical protein JCM11641_006357 [Rhodosporidiobolus odoratus]
MRPTPLLPLFAILLSNIISAQIFSPPSPSYPYSGSGLSSQHVLSNIASNVSNLKGDGGSALVLWNPVGKDGKKVVVRVTDSKGEMAFTAVKRLGKGDEWSSGKGEYACTDLESDTWWHDYWQVALFATFSSLMFFAYMMGAYKDGRKDEQKAIAERNMDLEMQAGRQNVRPVQA